MFNSNSNVGGSTNKQTNEAKKDEIDQLLSSVKCMMGPFKICMGYLSDFLGLWYWQEQNEKVEEKNMPHVLDFSTALGLEKW